MLLSRRLARAMSTTTTSSATSTARRGSSVSARSGQQPRGDTMLLERKDMERQLRWKEFLTTTTCPDDVLDLWDRQKNVMNALNRALCVKRLGHFASAPSIRATDKERLDSFLREVSVDGFQPGQAASALVGVARLCAARKETEELFYQLALGLETKLSRTAIAHLENNHVVTVAWGFWTVARFSRAYSLRNLFPTTFENLSSEMLRRINKLNPSQLCSIGYHLKDSKQVMRSVAARLKPKLIASVGTDELSGLVGGLKVYLEKKRRFDRRRMNNAAAAAAATASSSLSSDSSSRVDDEDDYYDDDGGMMQRVYELAFQEVTKRRGSQSRFEITRALLRIDEQTSPSVLNEVVSACVDAPDLLDKLDAEALVRAVSFTVVRYCPQNSATKPPEVVTYELAEYMAGQLKTRSLETVSSNLLCKLAVALSRDVFDRDTAKALMVHSVCPAMEKHHMDSVRAVDACRLAASSVKLGAGDAETFFVPLARRLLARPDTSSPQQDRETAPRLIEHLNPLDLVQISWAFGNVLVQGDGTYEAIFGAIVKSTRAKLHKFSGQQLLFLVRAFSAARYVAPSLFADVSSALIYTDALQGITKLDATPAETLRKVAHLAHEFAAVGICDPEIYETLSNKAVRALQHLDSDKVPDHILMSQLSQLFVAFSITVADVPDLFYETACPVAKRSLDRMNSSDEAPIKAIVQLCHALAVTGILQPEIVDGMWRVVGPERIEQLNDGLKADLHVVLLALRLECVECEFSRLVDANSLLQAQLLQNQTRSFGCTSEVEATLRRVGLYDHFSDRDHVTEDGILVDFANADLKEAILVPGKHAYLKRRVFDDPSERYKHQLKGERHFRMRVLEHLGWQVHLIPYHLWVIFDTPEKQNAYIMRKLRLDTHTSNRAVAY